MKLKISSIIGMSWFTYGIGYHIAMPLFTYQNQPRIDFQKRYGKKSWVVITGGSDGIGKQLAKQFAKNQFNICIVARNQRKTHEVIQKLKKSYPQVEYKQIIKDLSSTNLTTYKEIADQVKEQDVSILINNVGMFNFGDYKLQKPESIEKHLITNTFPQTFLSYYFLQRLNNRKNKSAIINIGSGLGLKASPRCSMQGATKGYGDSLSNSINYQNENIDVMSVKPGSTVTQMNQHARGFFVVTAKECVEGILNDLGKHQTSFGHWKHRVQFSVIDLLPQWLYSYFLYQTLRPLKYNEGDDRGNGKRKDY